MKTELLILLAGMIAVTGIAVQPTSLQSSANKPTATPAAPASSPAGEKTAGDVMKNVQVLKDVPASQWNGVMALISSSLGVGCDHCHSEPYEGDSKKAKQTARSMMKMVHEINAANFKDRAVVTCYTCHQGSLQPKGMPILWNKTPDEVAAIKKQRQAERAAVTASTPAPKTEPAEPLPAASGPFASYRKAVGSGPVNSIHFTGAIGGDLQQPASIELDAVFPDKWFVHNSFSGAEVRTVVNGQQGWSVSPQGKRDLSSSDIEGLRDNFDRLLGPVKFANLEATGKVTGSEKILDRTYTVVESESPKAFQRLYFDSQSGLLYKAHVENRISGFGVLPLELLYEDYREVNGVKFPFSVTVINTSDRVHLKISELQTNMSVDPAKFEAPPPAAAK